MLPLVMATFLTQFHPSLILTSCIIKIHLNGIFALASRSFKHLHWKGFSPQNYKIYSESLPIRMMIMAVKVMRKNFSTVSGCSWNPYFQSSLGTFAKLWKVNISFVMSVCPSVRMEQLGSHWPDCHEIWYEYFSKICWANSSFIKIWQE
jgi:hypothetical protein